jgi:hypothetical protein
MHVHRAVTPETGTSDALMTLDAVHHHPGASRAGVTSDMICLRADDPSSDPVSPRP